jgi:formate dehydrogenase major subunit
MVRATIDGKEIEVPEGTTVLQAARMAGVQIPTLCDHPALKPYGGCRLCVVEVKGARTLMASCTLPVYNGIEVQTSTEKVHDARKFVLTLLFSERNHFCMFCQKTAGDCELQNAAYGEEMTHWPISPNWSNFQVDASCPHFVLDHNRCILCRRCVRACGDLVGNYTLNLENRGARSLIIADTGVPFAESSCIRCGTCVQVCPTGALIDRTGVYVGLETQSQPVQSTCIGCSVGCGTEVVVRGNELIRVNGDFEAPVNAGVMCETGRYQSTHDHRPRITSPLVRKDGSLQPASWEEALSALTAKLQQVSAEANGVAALASTRLPAEALHAFKELFTGRLNSGMVAGIEEDATTALPANLPLTGSFADLKDSDCVLVVGTDLVAHHQVAGFFVKRNLANGTRLILVDPGENRTAPLANYALQVKPGSDAALLAALGGSVSRLGLSKAAEKMAWTGSEDSFIANGSAASGIPAETIVAAARDLGAAARPVIVIGRGVSYKMSLELADALAALAKATGARIINTAGKANSLAAHAFGLDRAFDPAGYQAAVLALGDDYPTPRLVERLSSVPFLAVQASHQSAITERADVVLPVEMWAEQEGVYMNMEGRIQQAHRAITPPAGVRSNLQTLEALAAYLGVQIGNHWQEKLAQVSPLALNS